MNLEAEYWSNPNNYLENVRLLIESGIDVNKRDENGQTLLYKTQNPLCVDALVKAGADINVKDKNGDTPLHFFARLPNKRGELSKTEGIYFDMPKLDDFFLLWASCAEVLVKAGADINLKNKEKETPLFGCFNPVMVDLLLDNGANPLVKLSRDDVFGQITPRDFIEFRCWSEREKLTDEYMIESQVMRIGRIEKSLKKAEEKWKQSLLLDQEQKKDGIVLPKTISHGGNIVVDEQSKIRE